MYSGTNSIIPETEFYAISFSVRGSEDNKNRGYTQVISPDNILRDEKPAIGGIYDSHMGTTSNSTPCNTCFHFKDLCPGHFGYIQLNYPVPSPLFLREILLWLKAVCHNCGAPIADPASISHKNNKMLNQFVKKYYSSQTKKTATKCSHCNSILPKLSLDTSESTVFVQEYPIDENSPEIRGKSRLYPHEIKQIFDRVTNNTVEALGGITQCHPRKYILDTMAVPPNTIRPNMTKTSAGRSGSNDLTIILKFVVEANNKIPPGINSREDINEKLSSDINTLSMNIFELVKGVSATSNKRGIKTSSNKQLVSLAKRFPGKYGRIRRHVMGRRVTHMARSVITCDTALRINQVGIPIKIAENIHIGVKVREYNYNECLAYFNNGISKQYPGAHKIFKKSRNSEYLLDRVKSDLVLEIGDIIYRDIIDGDIVNFNRQPSLESSNITSHRAVIMEKGNTIRINVLACPLYNADFDGDAMNILFPSSSITQNEIEELASPEQRYISEKNARPRIGEAQDSLIGTAELTKNSTKMDKFHAMQMFAQSGVFPRFDSQPSTKLYSGRDIVSIYLKESEFMINYTGKPFFYKPEHARFQRYDESDISIEIDRGELKSGVLDKSSIGEGAAGGIFHTINNQYGPEAALEACFGVQQLALAFLFNHGFTVSMKDITLSRKTMAKIHEIEANLIADSMNISDKLNKNKIVPPIGKTISEYFEELQINALNPGDEFLPWILSDIDSEKNNLFKLISHGSKGQLFNLKNISAAIGQIEINGERIQEKFGGRASPYFSKNDEDPKSRGYITNSYRSGMEPSEFMFHAQEARFQLISTALNTSVTGMHNRMAVKNLESLTVNNRRLLVKNSGVVQFVSGGDNVDPRRIQRAKFNTMDPSLTDKEFEKMFRSHASQFGKKFSNKQVQQKLDDEFAKLVKDREWYTSVFLKYEGNTGTRITDVLQMPVNVQNIIEDTLYNLGLKNEKSTPKFEINPAEVVDKVKQFTKNIPYVMVNEIAEKNQARIPKIYRDSTKLLRILIRGYLNVANLTRKKLGGKALDIILRKIKMMFSKSLVNYGTTLGLIAAQCISEPMTQMMLDSKHHSGASSTKKKGMFRIQEILGAKPTEKMLAPSMTLDVIPEFREDKAKVQEIANHIETMMFKDFVLSWQLFFEEFGKPAHPAYKHEQKQIEEFRKFNSAGKTVPGDLSGWCIRVVLDKYKLIEKHLKMETIYLALRKHMPSLYVVYSSDNSESVIMRLYPRIVMLKHMNTNADEITKTIVSNLLEIIVRGIPGVNAAFVKEGVVSEKTPEGNIADKKIYYIFTDGTNLEAILENPYINPDTVQSDSVLEMGQLFGIGAARDRLIAELKGQIGGPSYRHYTIYADEMTYSGFVSSIDRYGSTKRESSMLSRISDASPIAVIEDSAANGVSDMLKGVSPAIMLGQSPKVGDLYNGFEWDEKFVDSQIKSVDTVLDEL